MRCFLSVVLTTLSLHNLADAAYETNGLIIVWNRARIILMQWHYIGYLPGEREVSMAKAETKQFGKKGMARTEAHSLRTLFPIPSGPDALFMSSFCRIHLMSRG